MKTTEDKRLKQFAKILVEQGAKIEKGDNVYLLGKSLECLPLFEEVRRQIIQKGGYPHEHLLYDSQVGSSMIDHDWIKHSSEEQLDSMSEAKMEEMKRMDAYIRIGGEDNSQDLSCLESEKISKWNKTTEELLNERLDKKWVATRFPTSGMAQNAEMSTAEFEELVFSAVVDQDYSELKQKNQKVKEKFDNAEEVRIVGENTDISLSLENREGVKASGVNNIPDGEVFYAPVKESVNGEIEFTYPGVSNGNEVHGIKLKFVDGKVVSYSAEKNEEFLEEMLNTDESSKYLGELGIGTNRMITDFVKDTLFDEKMGGTIHMALGRAYEKCVPEDEERNQSGIHWDIVKDLRTKAGGGKLIVDGEVVQKNGEWQFPV